MIASLYGRHLRQNKFTKMPTQFVGGLIPFKNPWLVFFRPSY
jgi:hypothetical protein